MKTILTIFLSFLLASNALAQEALPQLEGYWQTEDKDAVIEFYKCEESYCGRFVWLKDDSAEQPSLDDNNKDPEKRTRPLCGLTLLGGFHDAADGRFTNGWIYSPRHGHEYSAELHFKSADLLELRGYMFIPLLGGGQDWMRTEKPEFCSSLKAQ